MGLALGSRVELVWTDGTTHEGTLVEAREGWLGVRVEGEGEPRWVPVDKATFLHPPVGAQITARGKNPGIGTVIAGERGRALVRWAGKRARGWVSNEDIAHIGPGSVADTALETMSFALMGVVSDRAAAADPRQPPNAKKRPAYKPNDRVWAKAQEDGWWYEARVVERAEGSYVVEWADGVGRATLPLDHLRAR